MNLRIAGCSNQSIGTVRLDDYIPIDFDDDVERPLPHHWVAKNDRQLFEIKISRDEYSIIRAGIIFNSTVTVNVKTPWQRSTAIMNGVPIVDIDCLPPEDGDGWRYCIGSSSFTIEFGSDYIAVWFSDDKVHDLEMAQDRARFLCLDKDLIGVAFVDLSESEISSARDVMVRGTA